MQVLLTTVLLLLLLSDGKGEEEPIDDAIILDATDVDVIASSGCDIYSHYCIRLRHPLDELLSMTPAEVRPQAIANALVRDGIASELAQKVAESISSQSRWLFVESRPVGHTAPVYAGFVTDAHHISGRRWSTRPPIIPTEHILLCS